jgi:hypothetical protein
MPKNDDMLKKLAWILEADPDTIASEPLAKVRQDLIEMGIDPEERREDVEATVTRWLQAVIAAGGLRTPNATFRDKGTTVPPEYVIAGAAMVPWESLAVQMAFGGREPRRPHQLIAQVDTLSLLNLEPHVRIDITPARVGRTLVIALVPRAHPKRARRFLGRKPARIEVHLLRKGERRVTALFTRRGLFQKVPLLDYAPGEESEWTAEVAFKVEPHQPPRR